jgi:hypothetical protein
MNPQAMTLEQIREQGLAALRKHLGIVGMVRFLQQSEMGWGNYTEERYQWLGEPDLEALAKEFLTHPQTVKTLHRPGADCLQRLLLRRSRFRLQLRPGVRH